MKLLPIYPEPPALNYPSDIHPVPAVPGSPGVIISIGGPTPWCPFDGQVIVTDLANLPRAASVAMGSEPALIYTAEHWLSNVMKVGVKEIA